MSITLLLFEFHGRWDGFDPGVWWHWPLLLFVLSGGGVLKLLPSLLPKPSTPKTEDKAPPDRLRKGEIGAYLRRLAREAKNEGDRS